MDLAYQPIVNLKDGSVPKVEALLRLTSVSKHVAEYITFCECSGRIKNLTSEVLDLALSDWRRFGRPGVGLSVNLSASNLDEQDLARRVERALKRHKYHADVLWFELGEQAQQMHDRKRMACMRDVASLGVRFSLDSFGDVSIVTLGDLGRLPWREIKIDGTIVTASAHDLEQRRRIKSAIGIAQQLGVDVSAKGVETANVAALVTRLGCSLAQGHYFAEPASAPAIGGVLDALQNAQRTPVHA